MDTLKEIKNLITIHNGKIIKQCLEEEIDIVNTTITVKQASDLYIVYTGEMGTNDNVIINVCCNVDMVERYQFDNDSTLIKTIHVYSNCRLTRYVDNATVLSLKIDIQDSVVIASDASVTCAYVELSNSHASVLCNYDLIGQNANVVLRLAALSKQEEKKHYTVSIQHLAPFTSGIMDNYGVVKEHGSLVIDGIGTIKKGNFQSNSHQTNKIIVFDQGGNAKANPYLYIDEYDVKASHGASVGKIDEDHLYYLQSRGLSHNEAMHLVTYGYFIPVLEFIKKEEIKEQFSNTLKEKVGI